MISDIREGGHFSKIGESLCKKAFSIGGKSEIGRRGGQKWPQKIGYHLREKKTLPWGTLWELLSRKW